MTDTPRQDWPGPADIASVYDSPLERLEREEWPHADDLLHALKQRGAISQEREERLTKALAAKQWSDVEDDLAQHAGVWGPVLDEGLEVAYACAIGGVPAGAQRVAAAYVRDAVRLTQWLRKWEPYAPAVEPGVAPTRLQPAVAHARERVRVSVEFAVGWMAHVVDGIEIDGLYQGRSAHVHAHGLGMWVGGVLQTTIHRREQQAFVTRATWRPGEAPDQRWQQELLEAFPWAFTTPVDPDDPDDVPGEPRGYFAHHGGWSALLWDALSRLDAILTPEAKNAFSTLDLKEKWGDMSWYVSGAEGVADDIVRQAEAESARTCEVCGQPGRHVVLGGWHSTRCARHAEEDRKAYERRTGGGK